MSHAYLAYPVVGLFALAASLPIAMPSVFIDTTPSALASSTRASAPTVVVSTSPAAPADLSATAMGGPVNPPPTDDRWWRAQVARVMTTSVVTVPEPPKAVAPVAPTPRVVTVAPDRPEPTSRGNQPARPVATPAPEPRLSAKVPAQIRRWEPLILKAAKKYDIDPTLIAAVIMTESSGDEDAGSNMGAIGLMQILGGPWDPEANIDLGTKMLSQHLKRFKSLEVALAAYNAGPTIVAEYGGVPPYPETKGHIAKTLANYSAWKAA